MRPKATQPSAGIRVPILRPTATFREPSAFITTADQLPFSTGHLIVWVPVPDV